MPRRKKVEEPVEAVVEEVEETPPVFEEEPEIVDGVQEEQTSDVGGIDLQKDYIFWREVRIAHKKYWLNSLGEAHAVNVQGYVDHEPTFVRKMDGGWEVLKGSDHRGFKRLTPRMERDLEIALVRLVQHKQATLQ